MKKLNKKVVALVVSLVFVIALAATQVTAYLTATTPEIENTFVAATSILNTSQHFELKEHEAEMNGSGEWVLTAETTNTGVEYAGLLPGMSLKKDPTLSIDLAIGAHVYLKVVALNMTAASDADIYNWTIDETWGAPIDTQTSTDGEGNTTTTYIYVKTLAANTAGEYQTLNVIKNQTVNVENYDVDDAAQAKKQAKLTFSAYAVQSYGVEGTLATYTATFVTP